MSDIYTDLYTASYSGIDAPKKIKVKSVFAMSFNGSDFVLATTNDNSVMTFTDVVAAGDLISMEMYYSTNYRTVSDGAYIQFDPV